MFDEISYTYEALAKLSQTVTPVKAGVQKSMKNLDSVFQRNDDEALLQKARMGYSRQEIFRQWRRC
jgi:hypothetical protein